MLKTRRMSQQATKRDAQIEGSGNGCAEFVISGAATRLPLVFVDARRAGRPIVFANDGVLALSGYTRAELLGQGFAFLLAGSDAAVLAQVEAAFGHEDGGELELRYVRKDGQARRAALSINPVRDEAGAVLRHCVFFTDLSRHTHEEYRLRLLLTETEQQRDLRDRAEAALRESEKAYRDLFEMSPDGIVAWDQNGVIVSANSSAATLLGYDAPGELIGRNWLEFIDAAERPALVALVERAGQSGDRVGAEVCATRKDGSRAFLESRLQTAGGRDGAPVRNIVISRDITERKEAEKALQRLNRMLRNVLAANTAMMHAKSERELLDEMCRVAVELGGYRLVWIGFAEHDKARLVRPVAWAGEYTLYPQTAKFTWADDEWGRGPAGTAIRSGETQVNQNIALSPAMLPWRTRLVEFGLKATAALPLKDHSGAFGVITLYAAEADAFGADEMELLEEMASNLAYGIQALRDHAGREAALASLDRALKATVQAIADAVETHDGYTAGHQRNVANLAVAIGRELGLSEWQAEGLYLAATIHDVGKLSVPAEFLSKVGKLTPLEYQLIQTHVQAGYDIVKDVNFPWPVARSILEHHERLDGSGYPNHLKGEQISIEGRILAVADVVDAMQSHRPYRGALGLDAALAELDAGRGRLYDPAVVDACVHLFREKGFRFH